MAPERPLQGLTFLNTRDARNAPALTRRLHALGAQVVECPTIELAPPASWAPFDARLASLEAEDWVLFTSANAVRAACERLAALGREPAALERAHLAAIGRGTAAALERVGLTPALIPATAQQEGLLEALRGVLRPGQRVWLPRAEEARAVLEDGLRAAGHEVTVTPVYRTIAPVAGLGPARDALLNGRIQWMLFTSSSTVRHFAALLDEALRDALAPRWPQVGCIGAVTAQAARDEGLPVTVVPARQDLEGLLAAVVAQVTGRSAPPEEEA